MINDNYDSDEEDYDDDEETFGERQRNEGVFLNSLQQPEITVISLTSSALPPSFTITYRSLPPPSSSKTWAQVEMVGPIWGQQVMIRGQAEPSGEAVSFEDSWE